MSTGTLEPLLRARELAEQLGWSVQKVRKRANHPNPKKKLPCVRVDTEIYFKPSAIAAWLAAREEAAEDAPQQPAPAQPCEEIPTNGRYA